MVEILTEEDIIEHDGTGYSMEALRRVAQDFDGVLCDRITAAAHNADPVLTERYRTLRTEFRARFGNLLDYRDEVELKKCTSVLCHGPGHQSKTFCQVKGEHTLHRAELNGRKPSWTGDKAFSSYFDEYPEVKED